MSFPLSTNSIATDAIAPRGVAMDRAEVTTDTRESAGSMWMFALAAVSLAIGTVSPDWNVATWLVVFATVAAATGVLVMNGKILHRITERWVIVLLSGAIGTELTILALNPALPNTAYRLGH